MTTRYINRIRKHGRYNYKVTRPLPAQTRWAHSAAPWLHCYKTLPPAHPGCITLNGAVKSNNMLSTGCNHPKISSGYGAPSQLGRVHALKNPASKQYTQMTETMLGLTSRGVRQPSWSVVHEPSMMTAMEAVSKTYHQSASGQTKHQTQCWQAWPHLVISGGVVFNKCRLQSCYF